MNVKLIEFFKENKNLIIIYIIFGILFFFISPAQKRYYFENDINRFDDNFYLSFSVYSILFILLIVLIVSIIKKIAIKNILFHLCRTLILSCLLFIFCHTTILSLLLLANRINSKGTEIKHYKIIYITNDKYLSAFNINNDKDIIDQNDYLKYSVKDKIENLTVGDTLSIEMQKGLFGVNYFNK
ncbi:hypothetical protein [Epilithonimonas xixisoli]|uniref:Uncharacterized protein n=1 Tax=Epilithonimonas xixisoli TaxID=1476462 RepID=A0A4V3H303_9FLAO|nr:hypothetical protein [Epilithonimonas xixisoli]TDX87101.1 hypothetical protein B0I22_1281 [Epilithonimonas xixisoli]